MKHFGVVVLTGVGLLQGISATCCRTNKCLKAVVAAGPLGLADCAAKLTVTVTTSSLFQETVTVVHSGVATSLYTETTTATVSTETLLFTESTTTTASTHTDITTTATTVAVSSTDVSTAPPITSTQTVYQNVLQARQTDVPEVPAYASGACGAGFARYSKACSCAGVKVVTVTAEPSVKTVTIEGNTVTSIYSTYASTETSTDLVTATTSTTLTNIISVTDTVASTTTETASSTTIISETVTPTPVATLTCKPVGSWFHAQAFLSTDGSTRWLNNVNGIYPSWQVGFTSSSPIATINSATWVLDANGYLESALPPAGASQVTAAYIDLVGGDTLPATVRVLNKPKSDVEAAVAAGTFARVKGCVNAETGEFTLSVKGRHNVIMCGNTLFMSTGNGLDYNSSCKPLSPVAVPRTWYR